MRFEKIFNLLTKRKTAAFDLLLVLKAKSIRVLQVLFHICSNPTLKSTKAFAIVGARNCQKVKLQMSKGAGTVSYPGRMKTYKCERLLKVYRHDYKGIKKKSNVWSDFGMWASLRTFQLIYIKKIIQYPFRRKGNINIHSFHFIFFKSCKKHDCSCEISCCCSFSELIFQWRPIKARDKDNSAI